MRAFWVERTQREKTLLGLLGLGVLLWGMVCGIGWPLWQQSLKLQQEHQSLLAISTQLKQALDPQGLAQQRQKLTAQWSDLSAQSAQLEADIATTLSNVAPASQMVTWLKSALSSSNELTLLSLKTLPSKPLSNEANNRYFIHPMTATFRGQYGAITRYLQALEALPMKYHWQTLNYRVTQYPWAEVTLTVSSISDGPAWLPLGEHK